MKKIFKAWAISDIGVTNIRVIPKQIWFYPNRNYARNIIRWFKSQNIVSRKARVERVTITVESL